VGMIKNDNIIQKFDTGQAFLLHRSCHICSKNVGMRENEDATNFNFMFSYLYFFHCQLDINQPYIKTVWQ
jgi:hypothetical protein